MTQRPQRLLQPSLILWSVFPSGVPKRVITLRMRYSMAHGVYIEKHCTNQKLRQALVPRCLVGWFLR